MCDGSSVMACMRSDCFWCEPTGLCVDAGCATNVTAICPGMLEGYTGFYEDDCGDQLPRYLMIWFTFVWWLALVVCVVWLWWPFRMRWRVLSGVSAALSGFVCLVILAIYDDIAMSLIIQSVVTVVFIVPPIVLRLLRRKPEPESDWLLDDL